MLSISLTNMTCLRICILLWNGSTNAEAKLEIIGLSKSQITLDKHEGLQMLIDLMHEELYMRGIRKNLESYVQELETTLNQVNLEEGQAEALFTLDEKDKSRIGSYFSAMFEGKCIHKIPFPRIGIVTTENVTD